MRPFTASLCFVLMTAASGASWGQTAADHVTRGREHLANAKPAEAAAAFGEALALEPDNAEALLGRGRACVHQRRFKDALKDLDRLISKNDSRTDALCLRAVARRSSGDPKGALKDISRAITLEPGSTLYLVTRGNCRAAASEHPAAQKDYDAALEIDAKSPLALAGRANVELQTADPVNAASDLEKAIALAPTWAFLHNNLAIAYIKLGQKDDGIEALSRAVAADPKNPDYYVNRGQARFENGDREGALEDFTKATELDPKDQDAKRRLSSAKSGKTPEPSAQPDIKTEDVTGLIRGADEIKRAVDSIKGIFGSVKKKQEEDRPAPQRFRRIDPPDAELAPPIPKQPSETRTGNDP